MLDKIEEEVAELRQAVEHEGPARAEEEMGDLLFTMANLARKLGIEPEVGAAPGQRQVHGALRRARAALAERGRSLQDASLDEMEAAWQHVKAHE